jgi:arabinofuranan 3-O-arabinosyltransferase
MATAMIETKLLKSPEGTGYAARRAAWRLGRPRALPSYRLLACCLLLAVLPFATAPGDIISDTKFELAVNPAGFLSGALTLWNPQQFGGLLDQAVGYLFPMGPFFELLRLLDVSGWIVQRLWLAALLIAALCGTERLAARMAIGTPGTRLTAGLAYALSPAALSMLGQTSGEFLPMAMMPWIILPLADMRPWIRGLRPGDASRRLGAAGRARSVARSAVAVALSSGMNAASTIAVLVPAVIYILTRPRGGARARMLAWWLPAVALVISSWSVPLILLSKYGVSIVPFTESAQVTSSTTSLLNIFHGTESWIGYQVADGQPDRPLAFLLATGLLPTLLVGLLAALGLAGLAHRDTPERRFLLWSLLGGVVIISLGYAGSLGNPLERLLISVINGPASPFRNLWKFDPMVRLPLALGIAHLAAAARRPRARTLLAGAAAVGLAGLAVPAVTTGLASAGSFGQVPAYWMSAAGWLTAHAGNQAVLVEPGAPFGQYIWGSPMDDALQALTKADYAERNLGVVGSVGNERLLDAIDQQFAAGDGSAGLTAVLARMGVKYLVVRNDLSRSVLAGAWPARIHDAIAASPGITLAAQFGPTVGGGGPDDAVSDFDTRYPAVQVYQVADAQSAAVVQPAAGTLRVYGAPESLVALASAGLLGDRPVLINDDGAGEPVAGSIVTDSLRRRVVNFGGLRTNYSPTLTAGQAADTFLSTYDYTEPGWSKYQAVARYTGIKDVTASSSASDITTFPGQWATGMLPYAAVDNNLATMWESGSFDGPLGQWIQADFDAPVDPGTIKVAFADNPAIGPPVTRVMVSTAAGQVTDPIKVTGNLQPLRVPAGATNRLRITVTGLGHRSPASTLGTQVGIAAIIVPGVSAGRTIAAPPVPGADPSAVVLAKAQPYQSGCMLTAARWTCSPQLATTTEEEFGFDQSFTEPHPERAALHGTAILINSSLVDRYALLGGHQPAVTASSTYTPDPQDQPRSAFDRSPATTWIASPLDPHPRLTISWGYARTVRRVTIKRPPDASGLKPVLITGSGGQSRGAMIGTTGVVTFPPMTTASLTFTFPTDQAPVQVTGVAIPKVAAIGTPTVPFRLPCGLGPWLEVNGKSVPTRVSGTFPELLSGRPMTFTACSPVTLAAGDNQVTETQSDAFDVQEVVLAAARGEHLSAAPAAGGAAPVAATVESWTSSARTLRVAAASRSYLIVNENFNSGWQAVLDGRRLQPVRLDGWKQAWVLPAGSAGVVALTFPPQSLYSDAVVVGLTAIVIAIIVAIAATFSHGRPRARRALQWSAAWHPPAARWRRRRLWPRWSGTTVLIVSLSGLGLLLGGYLGAIGVPVVAGALAGMIRGRFAPPDPWLLGGLLGTASAVGAVGERLVLSGDSGLLVSTLANAIPQAMCLTAVGGIAAALIREKRCAASSD